MKARRKGYVLIAVLWMTVLITAVVAVAVKKTKLDQIAAINLIEAQSLDAALNGAIETMRSRIAEHRFGNNNEATRGTSTDQAIPDSGHIGIVNYSVDVIDPSSKINLHTANERTLSILFVALGFDATRASVYADALRSSQVTSFESIDDVLNVAGLTDAEAATVRSRVTLFGTGRININSATAEVLQTLPGFNAESAAATIAARRQLGQLNSLSDLLPYLSLDDRRLLQTQRAELTSRIIFISRDVEFRIAVWFPGGSRRDAFGLITLPDGDPVVSRLTVR